jgi:DNA polymerase III gamma/tau subunit
MFTKELDQELVYEFFERVFQTKKLVRSYLFLGDNKADKSIFAYNLAKILNCQNNKRVWLDKIGSNANQNSLFVVDEIKYQEACELCQSCLWLNEKTHPKTPIFVEGTGIKNTIQIETIRKLQEDLCQSSEYFRVIVFDDASTQVLNKSSSTALLKTIEEAKPNTLFLFFTDSKENVLSTIVSRCQYINFKASKNDFVIDEIQDLKTKILKFLNSSELNDELSRLSFSEEAANEDRDLLIAAFALIQKDYSSNNLNLGSAKAIFVIEDLIFDIKSFVKVKATLKNCFDKLANLEMSCELAEK